MQAHSKDQDMTDDDDATVTSGSRKTGNGPVEAEIFVRFQLPLRPNVHQAKQLQAEVLQTILQAFPNEIVYIDNKNQEFAHTGSMHDEGLLAKVKNASMTVHEAKSKTKHREGTRWISVLKFRTTTPFRDWKKHQDVLSSLRTSRVYMTRHQFAQNKWDIISLGFLLGIHIVQFPMEAAKALVEQLMKHSEPNPPPFSLTPAKIQIKGKPSYTRAYEVVCHRDDGQKLYHLMTHDKFREPKNKIFIPYSLKRNNPSTFLTMIKENNQMLGDSYVMKFHGIPPAGIAIIEQHLVGITGVRYVVPTSKSLSHGEWRILIKASKFQSVNSQIRKNWNEWSRTIPNNCFDDLPDSYPAPDITSKNVKYIVDREDSSADSYGTLLSTASTITTETMQNDDSFDMCPLDDAMPSYAQVLTGNNHSPSPASTITQSVQHLPNFTPFENNSTSDTGYGREESQHLQERLQQQDARIQELDNAKNALDQRLEQILEEVHSKECRTKELENTIANLLNVVADKDKQMAEKDMQFDLRNRQFDTLMERLQALYPAPSTQLHAQEQPSTPARSNKRQNTLPTPGRQSGPKSDQFDNDSRMDISDDKSPQSQC